MRLAHSFRFFLSTFACIALMLLGAGPQLLWILYVVPRFSGDEGRLRDRLFAWQTFWSRLLLNAFARMTRLKIEYELPAQGGGNAIIVANHRSWLDIFLVAGALHRIGLRRLTAIVKMQVRRIPVLGRFSAAIRCALITRNNTYEDVSRIIDCARDSRDSDASVIIFPEGTRFNSASPRKGGFESVLRPKHRGLGVLLESLPDYRLVAVTVKWPPGVRVRTITDGATLVGKTLTIKAAEISRGGSPADLLDSVWREMDSQMSRR